MSTHTRRPVTDQDPTATRTGTDRPGFADDDPTAGRTAVATAMASEGAKAIADPAPLGLAGFALTTFILSLINAKLIPATTEPVVLGLALAYGGRAQGLAGLWGFPQGKTVGAPPLPPHRALWLSLLADGTLYPPTVPGARARTAARRGPGGL